MQSCTLSPEKAIDPLALSQPAAIVPESFKGSIVDPRVDEVDTAEIKRILELLLSPLYVKHLGAQNAALVAEAMSRGDPYLFRARISERTVRTLHLEPGPLLAGMIDQWYAKVGHDPRGDSTWKPQG